VAVEHHLSLADSARLFAQVNVASADAFIASFDAKYTYNFWRPVTAIRAADTDGNPKTVADSTWTPLIVTPNHPSYGSNHATQSRAAAEALAAFFGTDQVRFTATWDGVTRSYRKFTEAAKEAGKSRIYAGIHWSFDVGAGEALGRKVGQYVADHYFRPLSGSGGAPQVGVLPDGGAAGIGRGHEVTGALPTTVTAVARQTVGPDFAPNADELSVALTGFKWADETTGIGGRQSGRGSHRR
jgi:hypothetical protein